MSTFEDNAVVTAEDLNNIAVDLGDTTFSAFSEEKFGVDKLNQITADLVSKGILNTGNKCEAIIVDGKVCVQDGVIVFDSGAKIRIEEPITVDLVSGSYIYAVNNLLTGKASIEVGESLPTSGDYVSIAQVNESGEIVDSREMSVAKITLSADLQNNYAEQTAEFYGFYGNEIAVVPNQPSCQYLLFASNYFSEDSYHQGYPLWVKLSEEYQIVFDCEASGNNFIYIYAKKANGLLYFKLHHGRSYAMSFQLDFILM